MLSLSLDRVRRDRWQALSKIGFKCTRSPSPLDDGIKGCLVFSVSYSEALRHGGDPVSVFLDSVVFLPVTEDYLELICLGPR